MHGVSHRVQCVSHSVSQVGGEPVMEAEAQPEAAAAMAPGVGSQAMSTESDVLLHQ